MIRHFKHEGLKRFFETGNKRFIHPDHAKRLRLALARLEVSFNPTDMDLPGMGFHVLAGDRQGFYAVSISGNWRLIFRFEGKDAVDVDYLDYL